MKYTQYMTEIENQGYKLSNNMFKDEKGAPKCYNPVFQDLVERIQDNEKNPNLGTRLTEREYNLYGFLIMSLVQIVLNNHHFKHQDPDIREECRTEAYCGLLDGLTKFFVRTKGSTAYSYAFRICYTSMIHVLERMDKRRDLDANLEEMYNDYCLDCGHKVVNENVDYD